MSRYQGLSQTIKFLLKLDLEAQTQGLQTRSSLKEGSEEPNSSLAKDKAFVNGTPDYMQMGSL